MTQNAVPLPGQYLEPGDVGSRVARLRARFFETFSVQAVLVTSPANIQYLTGFTGAARGGLLVLPDRIKLFTDNRYRLMALRVMTDPHTSHNTMDVAFFGDRGDLMLRTLSRGARVVIESDQMTMAEFTRLQAEVPGIELVPDDNVVLPQRLIKDAGEVARASAAGGITSAAFEDLTSAEPVGWSEREIAAFLMSRMQALGAERPAFEPVVAVGPRTAWPHSRPGRQRLAEGEALMVDFGAEIEGYKADMTRTIWWGAAPPQLQAAARAVRDAYDAAFGALRSGASYGAIDAAARDAVTRHGLEQYIVHPTGHNVGLEIHEEPFFAARYEATVSSGNVVTLEPGLYVPDVGGVRLENTLVVSDAGPIALTQSPHHGKVHARRSVAPDRSGAVPAMASHEDEHESRAAGDEPRSGHVDVELLDDHQRFLIGDSARWQSVHPDDS